MSQVHVILADYDSTRLWLVGEALAKAGAVVHRCENRIEAMGKYWLLYAEGILPRAVVASWLMDTPESRSFFSAVGREVDHTSLALFVNVARLDPAGILVCYTDDMSEAVTELHHAEIEDKVMILRANNAAAEVASMIMSDERSSKTSARQVSTLTDRVLRGTRLSR